MNRVILSLAIGLMLLAAAPRAGAHQLTADNLNQMIASAKTPADHEAIADYYENQAAENQKMVVYHAGMANMFTKGAHPSNCRELVKQYRAAAEAAGALAKEHRAMANLNQKVTSAQTPPDHAAIADYYEKEAAEDQKMALYHAGMANFFTKGAHPYNCRELIKQYRAAAEANQALAKEHRAMVNNAK